MKPWVIIPAAGVGSRMNADRPKQFLPLADSVVLQHTLNRFAPEHYAGVVLVAPESAALDDIHWAGTLIRVDGGKERADSVLQGLHYLCDIAPTDNANDTWVLVHDAARPCVPAQCLSQLQHDAIASGIGSILALPVADTIKHETNQHIDHTVSRDHLWTAQTPQMFRSGTLRQALRDALTAGATITDEASAMEWAGHAVRLTPGHPCNIKITRPDDLDLAALYLQHYFQQAV